MFNKAPDKSSRATQVGAVVVVVDVVIVVVVVEVQIIVVVYLGVV